MQRSFGFWHTKCFPKSTPPSQEELENLCKELGFDNVTNVVGRITNSNKPFENLESKNPSNNSTVIPVEFQMNNATKVVAYSKFSAVKLNDGFTVHLRPSKPIAKLVTWDDGDHENCHRMDLKCEENKNWFDLKFSHSCCKHFMINLTGNSHWYKKKWFIGPH